MPDLALASLTEEDIQKQLAGDTVRGPLFFRGRPLARLTRGLLSLSRKVAKREDDGYFYDVTLLYLLAEACEADPAKRVEKRTALILLTDDVPTFRAVVSLWHDELTEEEEQEARRLTNEILGVVEKAEVFIAEKKSADLPDAAAATPSPTPMP